MKRMVGRYILVAAIALFTSISYGAVSDIEFSPGGDTPGNWLYTGSTSTSGTFSFLQQIDIDFVQGAQSDTLFNQFLYLPNLNLVNYSSMMSGMGTGTIVSGGIVEIQDAGGNVLLKGTLTDGSYTAIFATSVIYPEVSLDILVTEVNNTIGSDYLDTVSVGDYFDLNLTLQSSANFETTIQSVGTTTNGFSGSMTLIPEPATLILLSIGGMLIRKR